MRNRSLDGLRGLAIALVILYHHDYLNSGWIGVDFFFVLSGFLITRIIWKARLSNFFWRDFWIKRATRILPPFVILLSATWLLSFELSARQALMYFLSFGDVMAYVRPRYEVLRPLWSLAVEEHFYILWPFAVRTLPRRTLIWLLCTLTVAEPVARGFGIVATRDWQVVYFLTPFRLDGLALGCLLALLLDSPYWVSWHSRWSGSATVAMIALYLALRVGLGHDFTRERPTIIYSAAAYSLIAYVAYFFIAYLLTHTDGIAARLLSWQPLVFLGSISYGLYLYHVLLREILTRHFGFSIRRAFFIDVPLAIAMSWLSFRFYESPLIDWGKRISHTSNANPASVSRLKS